MKKIKFNNLFNKLAVLALVGMVFVVGLLSIPI